MARPQTLVRALLVASFSLVTNALPQAPDPTATIPANSSVANATAALYPPYTYTPALEANYVPDLTGLPLTVANTSVNPAAPVNATKNTTVPAVANLLLALSTNITPEYPTTYWYETITHDGTSPFIDDGADWTVFRNVKDSPYNAAGDGSTDDTTAIQNAINAGINGVDRGASGNGYGTTGAPAVVYIPEGTYILGSPIQLYLDTVLIGNPLSPPTFKASADFDGDFLVYAKDPAQPADNNFYIAVKNLIFDSTAVSTSTSFSLIDWSVSQATQLTNCVFNMPDYSSHTGVAMAEFGSGTILGDLTFYGGQYGINMDNQQYIVKSATFNGCNTGIYISFCADCVFQNLSFENCGTAIDASGSGAGSLVLLDSSATSVGNVINTEATGYGDHSIVIENLSVDDVGSTVLSSGNTILTGSVTETWVYGNAYVPGGPNTGAFQSGTTYTTTRSSALLSDGKYFTMPPPTYQDYGVDQVINIKTLSAYPVYGNGQNDDTANINSILAQYAGSAIIYFPAGTYLVTSTILIPVGSRIVGEVWSAISATGSAFSDASSPIPMVQVGNAGDVGVAQIQDMLFTVAEILPGCILLEINMAGDAPGDVGLWNSHFRVGGAAGSTVETDCGGSPSNCMAAFLMLHLTSGSSAYIEDMWGWTADHDLDGTNSENISTGRGALIESTVATWMVGTAFEHNTLYQYNLVDAQNVYIGMQQCETPYWQGDGTPDLAPAPWTPDETTYFDPDFSNCGSTDAQCRMAWFQRISGGSNLFIYGSGFWTFFNDYDSSVCSASENCQTNAAEIVSDPTDVYWFNLNTRANTNMLLNNGEVLCTVNNNPGSWGGIVAAMLTDE